jgi:fido (protein-threonine AMPylation protein)
MAQSRWPDLVFADEAPRASLSRAVAAGRLRRIGRGIYTSSTEPLEVVTRRRLPQILAHEFPGAVIVDRSARSGLPDVHGNLYVDHRRDRPLALPGVVIAPRPGPGPLPGDALLPDGVYLSSPGRGLLDNAAGRGRRFLSTDEIEAWIADLLLQHGESRLNQTRDGARDVARQTDRMSAFERLSRIISAALVTGPADAVRSRVLQARAADSAYDHERIASFEEAAAFLADGMPPQVLPELPELAGRRRLLPFYEAYFSNYIEGTEFTLDEAAAIVFDNVVPAERPEDAHDVLGTYRIVSDAAHMTRVPGTADELIQILRQRHGIIMDGRPGKSPGQFKTLGNRAGSTVFVAPSLVEGTLRAGFEVGRGLRNPFARAVFMMFFVSEVHPFADGNGRVARVMMNSELATAHEVRIVVPTVFRGEYLSALKTASNHRSFQTMASVLEYARRWTGQVNFESRASAERDLIRTNALVEPATAQETNARLLLPSTLDRVS